MKKIRVAIVRFIQFFYFVVFTSIVLNYFGILLLLPLQIWAHLTYTFAWIGLPGVLSALTALPILGLVGYVFYRTPDLHRILSNTGVELVRLAYAQHRRFEDLVQALAGPPAPAGT